METTIQITQPQVIQFVSQKIYEIRGLRVMMDYDLAELYGVETKYLKRAVNRNLYRFPADFMLQLSWYEAENALRCNFGTLNKNGQVVHFDDINHSRCSFGTLNNQSAYNEEVDSIGEQITVPNRRGSNIKYLPYAFTEQGVAMLSSVLNSRQAVEVNIVIMRAFVALRQYALNYAELSTRLDEFMKSTDSNFSEVFSALEELTTQKKLYENRRPIGFIVRDEPETTA